MVSCVLWMIAGYFGADKFEKQRKARGRIIVRLRAEGKDWEHIVTVLNMAEFKNRKGDDFKADEVEEEFEVLNEVAPGTKAGVDNRDSG